MVGRDRVGSDLQHEFHGRIEDLLDPFLPTLLCGFASHLGRFSHFDSPWKWIPDRPK
jgi:hypothetical protein